MWYMLGSPGRAGGIHRRSWAANQDTSPGINPQGPPEPELRGRDRMTPGLAKRENLVWSRSTRTVRVQK